MNSDASFKFGCKENVCDTCNQPLKEQNIKYTPNQKRPKLVYSVPHHSTVQEYAMRDISQVCTKENYCKKCSPKCLSRRVSFCSTASGELHLPIDTSSLLEENNALNENTTVEVQPQLRSYQLVGDSLLLRFAEQILHMEANTVDGVRSIGLCVSGQKVADLLKKVKLELHPVADKIVLLIGTNDILQKTEKSQLRLTMWTLLKELRRRARRIVLLTLPPIPKIQFRPDYWEQIEGFNMFIKSLEDDDVTVADISQLYITKSKTCKLEFFERYYRDGERKDLIHLNKLGLTEIYTYLTDNNCLI
ncbi:hypothetical protein B7P43_G12000 [Cryptotermes secundus]|uniref:OSK domain-containing protein n=1 Tax=Cryptotermes secundus TaxID=105785 RepID=A0A2J7R9Y0_9NEOP|nr:maternal effect protein oskar isoform X2 [Cryptotermes secundus]PNF37648.1 hypothetical protein B7P43_G12000 [Cryptotermes secundus]